MSFDAGIEAVSMVSKPSRLSAATILSRVAA
jgi:hypothetical protein